MNFQNHLKAVPGFEGYYADADGTVWSDKRGRLKLLRASWNGRYYNLSLFRGGRPRTVHLHVAICLAFHGPRPLKGQVRHLDGNPKNNAAPNLAWGTSKENNADRARHRTMPRGSQIHTCRISEADVYAIRHLLSHGQRVCDIAKIYGVSSSAIKHIKQGRSYAWLS